MIMKAIKKTDFLLLQLMVILCHVLLLNGERILGEENAEFDFDGLPGAHHEFKVYIPGSTEDCFFQPVAKGAKMHVNFEVLKGGSDNKVDFYIRDWEWRVIHHISYQSNGVYSLDDAPAGTYAICIDNAFNRFGHKLVYVFIVTFVMQEWVQFQQELGEVNILTANFSTSLQSVQESVSAVTEFQSSARFNVIRDYYLLNDINKYVQMWSVAQCVLIVVASLTQVFSLRRLFKTSAVTPTTSKPRA
ncbi:transmembrane emp24 domain-containing protein 7 [Biomphalaria glabrata]|uniref:Transmembrane emp24 domain-containing protein 7-like n=1 Tax=Biomphalaria glabrata TaxID=6526 RepID=A0A9U8E9Q6_BIOGL|nr:transmembrane emp24 domain-containing protein 7-like [Biomphalaria glabrata]KAI8728366.1 transmembrane emp24 domain-containing protein 7-like [Biomphalaria glabrata]